MLSQLEGKYLAQRESALQTGQRARLKKKAASLKCLKRHLRGGGKKIAVGLRPARATL